ncbi:putative snRNA transcription by RNA polymerase III [Trypoxylus dichotomus]
MYAEDEERPLMNSRKEEVKRYKAIQLAFRKDCENLLQRFSALETFSYEKFAEIWKDMAFSLVFSGKSSFDEYRHYTEVFLFESKNFHLFSDNIYTKTGAFYLMYGLYHKQPLANFIKVRVTQDEFSQIIEFVRQMKDLKQMHPLYIYCKMMTDDVFDFVYTQQVIAPDLRHFNENFVMEENTFKREPVEIIQSSLLKLLDNKDITRINSEYQKALAEYKENSPECNLMVFNNSILDNIRDILPKNVQDEPSTSPPSTSAPSTSTSDKEKGRKYGPSASRQFKIVPKSLKITLSISSNRAKRIANRASEALVRERINYHRPTLDMILAVEMAGGKIQPPKAADEGRSEQQ